MTPNDPTLTHSPQESGDSSEAAWDAGMAAAFGPVETGSHHPAADPEAGTILAGKYRLTERIGEGGMGSVWVAHQSEPVKRKVAIKFIKAGMDSKQVLARFEAERQALAVMDHPNIAKVLDGGLHDGRPFFVMELVKGVPITEYCDARKLTPKERLELFVPVCQAIQHAHQKGIIHRDIKPSNVLIALYDDKPVPKVIDFGIAKATGGTLTEQTIETAFGGVVGTPQYMSPEQASLNNLDIDTRSDVYSLGVLLYELLTGSPPFSRKEMEKKGLLEILRVVREEEPPRPSTKLSTADALPSLSANRGTEPKKLTGLLRNELDWIVMKALEKDRTRRYETANGFAADVNRYLSGEAVQAHPPSTAYRVKKFVRRNKGQVIAASLVFLALVAGVLGTTLGLLEARRQEGIARGEAVAKDTARAEAEANESKAIAATEQIALQLKQIELVNDSVFEIFGKLDIRQVKAKGEPVEAVLAKKLLETGQALDEKVIPDPLVLAKLRDRLGKTLRTLGYASDAINLFLKAREVRTKELGHDHRDTLTTADHLSGAYNDVGKFDLGVPLAEETLKIRKAKLGANDPDTIDSINNLAGAYRAAGKTDLVVPLLEEALKLSKTVLGADHPDTISGINNLAVGYQDLGKPDKAVPLLEESLKWRKAKLGPDHPDTITAINNLAVTLVEIGQKAKAVPLFEEALQLNKATLGSDHPDTLNSMNNLAEAYRQVNQLDQAMPLLEETLKLRKAKLGPEHPKTLESMLNLAGGYLTVGLGDRALALFEETLRLAKAKLGLDHPLTLTCMRRLAASYVHVGKFDLAVPLYEEILPLMKSKHGPDHPWTINCIGDLGSAYLESGQGEKAVATITAYVAAKRKQYPPSASRFGEFLVNASQELLQYGQFVAAEALLRESLAIHEKNLAGHWATFNVQSMLGGSLLGQKKYADAEPLLLKGYEGMKARERMIHKSWTRIIPESLDRLIELHSATNKPDEVKKWQTERAKYPAPKEAAPKPEVKK